MPVYFRHVTQILNRADYTKITKAALAKKNDAEPFVSFEKFTFADGTEGPLVVLGELASTVVADLKKSGKGFAEGVCAREDERLTFRHEKGKPTYKALKDALVGIGVRNDVRVEAALREGDILPSKAMGEEYRGEEKGEGWRKGTDTSTKYFDEARREENRLEPVGDRLERAGKPVDGVIGYVMDPKTGEMIGFGIDGRFRKDIDVVDGKMAFHHHSSPLRGEDVAAAGHVTVQGGRIVAIDDSSGHYKPNAELTYNAVRRMDEQGLLGPDQKRVDGEGNPLTWSQIQAYEDVERYAKKIAKRQRLIAEARAELETTTDTDERDDLLVDIEDWEEEVEKYQKKLGKAKATLPPGAGPSQRETKVHLQGKVGLTAEEFATVKGDLDALRALVKAKFGVDLYPNGAGPGVLHARPQVNIDIGTALRFTLTTSQFLQTGGNERAIRQKDRVTRFLERSGRALKPSEVKYMEQLSAQIEALGGDAEIRGRGLDPDAMTIEEQADVLTDAISRDEALKRWCLEVTDDDDTDTKKFLKLGGRRALAKAGLDPDLVDRFDAIAFLKGKIDEDEARLLWKAGDAEPGVDKLEAMGLDLTLMSPRKMVDVLAGTITREEALGKWKKYVPSSSSSS